MTAAIQELRDNLPHLSARDRSFADSLLSQVMSRGLSVKQWEWVFKLNERAQQARVSNPATVEIGNVAGILTLFSNAAALGKTRVAILLSTASGIGLRLTRARNGAINVKERGDWSSARYFGRIGLDGLFTPHHATPQPDDLVDALVKLSMDPAGTARAYGRKTGMCCFCARELTHPNSLAAGYGPECAATHNLPWG